MVHGLTNVTCIRKYKEAAHMSNLKNHISQTSLEIRPICLSLTSKELTA